MTQSSGIQKNLTNYEISVGSRPFLPKTFKAKNSYQMLLAKPSSRLFSLESHSAFLIKDKYDTKRKARQRRN